MPQTDVINVTYDEETGANQKFTFDDFVVPVPDHCLIADRSFMYLNMEHSSDMGLLKFLFETAVDHTGFSVMGGLTTLDRLLAAKIPLSRTQKMRFMAGHPIWHIPAMFTKIGRETDYTTRIGSTFNEAMAIQAVLGKTAIKKTLELAYQRRRGLANGRWYSLAEKHADEVVMEALGSRQSVDEKGNSKETPVNVKECDGDGKPTGREIIGSKRYTKKSVSKIAAKAINGSKKTRRNGHGSPYSGCIERASHEIVENVFDVGLDGVAIAAWYYRVVTALRIAASVCENIDSQRCKIITKLRGLNSKFQRLRRRERLEADRIRLVAIQDDISRIVGDYNGISGQSLAMTEGHEKTNENIIFDCIDPTIAAITAFYAGVNLRVVDARICGQFGMQFNAVLASLVWLGHLQRQRTRSLTPEIACAFAQSLGGDEIHEETQRTFSHCMEIGLSFLDAESRIALTDAVMETARTGAPRTAMLRYRSAPGTRILDELAVVADGAVPLQPSLQHMVQPDTPELAPYGLVYEADIGCYAGAFRPLALQGTFVSLPPFYERDWAGRWRFDRSEQDDRFLGFRKRRQPVRY
jgi:hypothetical protein